MSIPPAQPPAVAEPALGPYLRAVAAHRGLVALVTVAMVLIAGAWLAFVRTPTYEANAQLLVTPLPQDDETFLGLQLLRDSGDPTRTVQTAANLVSSPVVAQRTAAELGDDWTSQRVLDSIEVEPQGESNILAVTGSAGDAEEAARLADTFARQTLSFREEELERQIAPLLDQLRAQSEAIGGSDSQTAAEIQARITRLENVQAGTDPTLSISQTAEVPTEPTGAGPPIILALALIAGGALGAGIAMLIEVVDSHVGDEEEAVSLFPLPVLARIPIMRKHRLGERSGSAWLVPPVVREACRTLALQLRSRESGSGSVVMVTSASTGDGKTTSAINLSATLAASGERVILLDLDLRKADVARKLSVRRPVALARLLDPQADLESLLQTPGALPSVSVLATGVGDADIALLESLYHRLPELVADARANADHVVIDTPPLGEVSDALRVVESADDVVVVVRPGNTERAGLATTADLLARAGTTPAGFLVIGGTQPTSAYYAYGGGRELFGDGSPPARGASSQTRG